MDLTGLFCNVDDFVNKERKMNIASINKVFKDIWGKSKSTIGWFFRFKLHLIINEKGGLSIKD